jgi:hypothetical protein
VAGVCPAIGADTDCATIITITDQGATITQTGQGPFDGVEDTLVGVVNNSSKPITGLGLESFLDIFGFDGDGLAAFGVAGNILDIFGYGGPNAFFTRTPDFRSGTVNFITPVKTGGGTTFFALENQISSAFSCQQVINGNLHVNPSGANIDATFTPRVNGDPLRSLSLVQAAQICGFKAFDWEQTMMVLPSPNVMIATNQGGAFDPSTPDPVPITPAMGSFSDPPPRGGL